MNILRRIARELFWFTRRLLMRLKGFRFKNIGRHSYVKKPVRILNGHNVSIGENVFIMDGIRLETLEKWNGQRFKPQVKIGNRVTFGQFTHLICASRVTIHDDVSVGPFSMINDCTHGYKDPVKPLGVQDLTTAPIEIGEGTIIGMSVCILPGVTIGRHCYIGANTVISNDVADNTIVSAQKVRKVTVPYE